MGLAWTSLGGNALYIEAAVVEKGEGKGGLRTTGRAPGCSPHRPPQQKRPGSWHECALVSALHLWCGT